MNSKDNASLQGGNEPKIGCGKKVKRQIEKLPKKKKRNGKETTDGDSQNHPSEFRKSGAGG